ncbi:MAG: bifunctional adenosylcobinamide kinase/adenosylcobinamide-phosphate guanylyltransferase [Lachnospiraceae bacterium]|nr:bifunctional adenosylcobinamide kinase/adenosylcobinamide-phosphate guanylyltransferase [Lachnospiraceae bacterium]
MKMYITGGAKCGKSTLAQDTAIALSARDGVPRYYIATMQPADAEDESRIRRHIADRDGLDFLTIEQPRHLSALCETDSFQPEAVYLVDSVTALLANEMFGKEGTDKHAGDRVAEDLLRFAAGVRHAVFVSDGIYSDAALYDDLTLCYREALARIDRALASHCDTVAECVYGQIRYLKGSGLTDDKAVFPKRFSLPETHQKSGTEQRREDRGMDRDNVQGKIFVFGGAFQGKCTCVRETFGLRDADIASCAEDSTTLPADARCICHAERYVLACVRQGLQPEAEAFFSGNTDIVICDDISAGIVPVDPVLRKWREETGILMRKLSAEADSVIRVVAGIPVPMKTDAPDAGCGQH